MKRVGFCAGPPPSGPVAAGPYLHWTALTVKSPSSWHRLMIVPSCHEDAEFGCSWRKWRPAVCCIRYNFAQNSKWILATFFL